MPSIQTQTSLDHLNQKRYKYRTIQELSQLHQPSGAHWCCYGVIKFCRQSSPNCMMIGIGDPTSYGKGPKGASCLLFHESFAGTIELPLEAELGQIIRLHRMKITSYRPESGCIQLKSSNYYSWLLFDGKDDRDYDPIGQSSINYSFGEDDRRKIDELRQWLLSFPDEESLKIALDFQSDFLPESTHRDQSSQTNHDGTDLARPANDTDDSTTYFSTTG